MAIITFNTSRNTFGACAHGGTRHFTSSDEVSHHQKSRLRLRLPIVHRHGNVTFASVACSELQLKLWDKFIASTFIICRGKSFSVHSFLSLRSICPNFCVRGLKWSNILTLD